MENNIKTINPRKRLGIGRAQKRYKSSFLLLKNIRTESLLWISLVVLIAVDAVILLGILLSFLNTDKESFYQGISQSATGSSNEMLNVALIVPVILISARVLYNIIISILIHWGIKWYKDVLNHFTTIINSIISAVYLVIASYTMVQINIILFNSFEKIRGIHGYAFGEEGTVQTKMALLMIDVNMAALYLMFLFIIICLVVNSLRSVGCFVNSFDLLPRTHKINKELRIVNYHVSDKPYVKNMYINSSTSSDSRLTERDFRQFMKVYDMNNFRVLLRNGIPVGMYTIGDKKTILEEILIAQEYRNQGLGELLLKDFEDSRKRTKPTTLTARLYAEDDKAVEYLINQGWKETGEKGMNQREFQKTVQKGVDYNKPVDEIIGSNLNSFKKDIISEENEQKSDFIIPQKGVPIPKKVVHEKVENTPKKLKNPFEK